MGIQVNNPSPSGLPKCIERPDIPSEMNPIQFPIIKPPWYFAIPTEQSLFALLELKMPGMEKEVRQRAVTAFLRRLRTVGPVNSANHPVFDCTTWFLNYANRVWYSCRMKK